MKDGRGGRGKDGGAGGEWRWVGWVREGGRGKAFCPVLVRPQSLELLLGHVVG